MNMLSKHGKCIARTMSCCKNKSLTCNILGLIDPYSS